MNKNFPYALKAELRLANDDEPGLELEIGVLKEMKNCPKMVRYIDDGLLGRYKYVIMQLAGRNLSDLRRSYPHKRFTLNTSLQVSLQCLEATEALHNAGILHRDIKAANFAVGRGRECRNVYMLDFGLVRRYRLKDGSLRPARPKAGFCGTVNYASINTHNNKDLGRNDDVWSWLYMSIEFVKGKLPWRNQDKAKVGLTKAKSKEILLANMESEYRTIYESVEKLTFIDEPPYHAYRTSLNHIMVRKKFTGNEPLDWEEKVAEAVVPNVVPFGKENAKNQIVQEPSEVKEEGQEP